MKSYSGSYNKSFAGEIIHMEPWEWLIALAVALLILLLANLGFLNTLVAVMERPTLGLRTRLYDADLQLGEIYAGIGNLPALTEENKELKAENARLQARLSEVEIVFKQNQQLINETGLKYDRDYKQVAVKVINRDDNDPGTITINKGQKEGLKVNDIAVLEKILLGRVVEVSPYTAKVRLLINSDSQLPVKTSRSSLGILQGESGSQLKVEQILQSTTVNKKDKVYSSGLNGNFPPDLYIGEVTVLEADSRASTKVATVASPLNWRELASFKILLIPTS